MDMSEDARDDVFLPGGSLRMGLPKRMTTPSSSGLTLNVKAKKATTAAMPTAMRKTKDPGRPAPPGITCLSLSWLRFNSSSRSG